MVSIDRFAVAAACMALASCGGGGSVGSTPPPPVATATPTPTPTSAPTPTPIPTAAPDPSPFYAQVLDADALFSVSTTYVDVELDSGRAIVAQANADRGSVAIDFDAATSTYALEFLGRSQAFGPADKIVPATPGIKSFARQTASGGAEFLTIYTVPFISASYARDLYYNRYVAQANWQLNARDASNNQFTRYYAFVFGDRTQPTQMPVSGAAHWLVDVFGALAKPGAELLTVSGSGDFQVDFAAGAFQINSNLDESNFLTIGGTVGSLPIVSGGALRADGTFSGPLTYSGSVDLNGTLQGAFFGPGAAEVGATFVATGPEGTLNGSFTGQRSTYASSSAGIPNITLTDMLRPQRLLGHGAALYRETRSNTPATADVSALPRGGVVDMATDGIDMIAGGTWSLEPSPDKRQPDPSGQFERYAFTTADSDVEVAIYPVGGHPETIALTYMTFATSTTIRREEFAGAQIERREDLFSHFGLETPGTAMRAASGGATYRGLVYGRAASTDRAAFEVGGTSLFNLDFSGGAFDGMLDLAGTAQGGASIDLGEWRFAGELYNGNMPTAVLTNPQAVVLNAMIAPIFYGPSGEEIGASFQIGFSGLAGIPEFTEVAGVAIARREGE